MSEDNDPAGSVVIAAIPAKDDYVWKLSTEQVPHMTILYLGQLSDPAKLAHIETFVNHAADTTLTRFGLEVDHRGTLGPDDADALFFGGQHHLKKIMAFRENLLKDDTIAEAFSNADQFPEWTPHLTLGYPTNPAKPDNRDYPGISWVRFDTIAMWTGDFIGPEFLLNQHNYPELEMAMSERLAEFMTSQAMTSASALTHHGVKGMKWGVIRSDAQLAAASAVGSHGARGKLREAVARITGHGGARGSITEVKATSNANGTVHLKAGSSETQKTIDDLHPGQTFTRKGVGGVTERFTKNEDGSFTRAHPMTTEELRAAVNHEQALRDYNKLFNPSSREQLQQKVNDLNLQKQFAQLQREMNPSRSVKASSFIKAVAGKYATFQKVNKATDGALENEIRKLMGQQTHIPTHRRSTVPKKKRK